MSQATIICWFVREGQELTPGPLLALRLHANGTILFLSIEAASLVPGALLRRILVQEGEVVGPMSWLAVIREAGDMPEATPALALQLPALLLSDRRRDEQASRPINPYEPFKVSITIHHTSPLHAAAARRSSLYRRTFRDYYPLFEMDRTTIALFLALFGWFLVRFLSYASGGGGPLSPPLFPWIPLLLQWMLLLILAGFTFLLFLAVLQVVLLKQQLRRWRSLSKLQKERIPRHQK